MDLASVGLLRPAPGQTVGIEATSETIWFNKVSTLALDRLRGSAERSSFLELARRRETLDNLIAEWTPKVKRLAVDAGIGLSLIKGFPMQRLYEVQDFRDLGDIDALTSSIDDAWILCEALAHEGFEWCKFELPWIKRDRFTQRLYGQFAVWKWMGELAIRVDIHFGGYSVRHCGLMDAPASSTHDELDPMENLPLVVANAAGDFVVRMKDLNDLYVMLTNYPDHRDWAVALDTIANVHLQGFWNRLLSCLSEFMDLSPSDRELLERLRYADQELEAAPVGQSDVHGRTQATVRHALTVGGETAGPRFASSAMEYYGTPHEHRLATTCTHNDSNTIAELNNDTCVQLISPEVFRDLVEYGHEEVTASGIDAITYRVPLSGSRLFEVATDGKHAFLAVDRKKFATTILGTLCADQLRALGQEW